VEKVGLIAGAGYLPLHMAEEALHRGYQVVAIAFSGFTDPTLESRITDISWLRLGQVEKAITILKSHGIHRVIMAGKIEKSNLMRFWSLRPDRRAIRMLRQMRDWRDDTILATVADELLKEDIVIDEITFWAGKLMARSGVMTRKAPNDGQWKDIEFGRSMAQGIGGLDIGQTVIVRNSAVIAVEAIEGTDRAIRRAGDLRIPATVVVKMAKPSQDMRFDVPGVGPSTIDSMIDAKAAVLAVESGKTMITDYEEMISKANKAKISVVGVPPTGPVS
jgi:UDP-2,3-diacylglucosamine hydrolase